MLGGCLCYQHAQDVYTVTITIMLLCTICSLILSSTYMYGVCKPNIVVMLVYMDTEYKVQNDVTFSGSKSVETSVS